VVKYKVDHIIVEKGGVPLARLQLRLPTREGEKQDLNQWARSFRTPWYLSFPWQSPPLPIYSLGNFSPLIAITFFRISEVPAVIATPMDDRYNCPNHP